MTATDARAPRLLVVAPWFAPRRGGVENYAAAVAVGLAGRGWEVAVATAGEPAASPERHGAVRVHRLGRGWRISNTPVAPAWPGALRRVLAAERPDVLVAHTPVPGLADLAVRLSGRTPTVLTYHGDVLKAAPLPRLAWRLYRALVADGTLRLATRIVATSARYARTSPALAPHLEKVEIIPPGVDTLRFRPDVPCDGLRARWAGRRVLLFVGQLDRSHGHKGLGVLLQAVARVRRTFPTVTLLVAGAGDALAAHRGRAAALGVDGCTEFLGLVDDADLPGLYRLAEAAVLPSLDATEGFGMVLLEAAAAGTATIGSAVGGIPVAIEDGRTGLLVPPGDPAALAAALERVLAEPALAARLGAAGRMRAEREFTWALQVERHDRLLRALFRPAGQAGATPSRR